MPAIEVPNRHPLRPGDGVVDRGLERAVAVAQQHADAVIKGIAVTRSSLPSPLKSPTAKEEERNCPGEGTVRKVPSPLPSSTPRLELKGLVTARSSLPSLLKSPTATALPVVAPTEAG
jgi:hypothetical protein